MENTTFSFDNMAQKIFTPDSTGVKFNKESKNPSLTASIMKQSVLIADDDVKIDQADSYKDAIYRIKESEKIISKKYCLICTNFKCLFQWIMAIAIVNLTNTLTYLNPFLV